jgi:hypothetical protein
MARAVLAEIESAGAAFDASEPSLAKRLLNLDRASGEFVGKGLHVAYRIPG